MGVRCIKVSAVYFAIAVILGLYMSIVHDYALSSVHAHLALLGWTSFALAGIIYHLFPRAGENKLAYVHFWVHNIGLPVMLISLFLVILGQELFLSFLPLGAILVVSSTLLFTYNVIKNVRSRF
ncbi:cytochrome-c oxidase [Alteribacter lacisalsi]|uniref:Cytochrome-c oxidase n=1 Tax=Alteribacter lacisalsi TaxID=2045244 RepID=A0A2W0H4V6_9BACI|nr:cbb3-type cytochrome c oxidase subunit I [Alteribacter lacisalsi]PYZ96863.1 cytochrome-c oxidase [Alteribacter lacisalsi]